MASLNADVPFEKYVVERRLLAALMVMTVVTGFVDAVSYIGLGHVFTANMTGNVALLGFAVAGAHGLSVPRSLVSLTAFLAGALIGGRLGTAMSASPRQRWMLVVGMVEAALLFTAALVAVGYNLNTETPASRLYAVIILTALPMELRTATVRRMAIPDINTTVLTTTLAGLTSDSRLAGGQGLHIGRRVGSVVAMVAGACAGTLMLRFGLAVPLLLGGTCVLGATIAYAAASIGSTDHA